MSEQKPPFKIWSDFLSDLPQTLAVSVKEYIAYVFESESFDGEKWIPLTGNKVFKAVKFAEFLDVELQLDDLPWAEENLLEQVDWRELMDTEDEESFLELEKLKIPQVILLSSGEVSPFSLSFSLKEQAEPTFFIQGEFMAPVIFKREPEL